MGIALYRKYRPRSFEQAVGQETILKTLSDAVKSGRIAHAYLFAGPRGVGKTSVARILAHEVNQLPYAHDSSYLDIIEIDAASNRRIDEIRDLREKVRIAPAQTKYKVYIIDEVHMLTKEAFNALLKTLEEPPSHVIFILATTELHKLPETIISRTQRFNFKPIAREAAKAQLQKIANAEKLKITREALDLLSEYGDGSMRDIISALDQLGSVSQEISAEAVRDLLGLPPKQAVDELIAAIANPNPVKALQSTEQLKDQAVNPSNIAKALSQELRARLIKQELGGKWLNTLLRELVAVPASPNPQEALELAVLEASSRDMTAVESKNQVPSAPLKSQRAKKTPAVGSTQAVKIEPARKVATFKIDQWDELLDKVKSEAPSIYTALRLAEPSLKDGRLDLAFPFALHQKKVQEAKHIQLVGRLIEEVSGDKLEIACSVNKDISLKSRPTAKDHIKGSPELDTISSIFGATEVLES